MEIFSREPKTQGHSRTNSFVPVAVEIPASQISKIPEGQDLLIRVKKNSVISNEYIGHNEQISETRQPCGIQDEDDYVFRFRKPSLTSRKLSLISIDHHVVSEVEPRVKKISRQEGFAQLFRTLSTGGARTGGGSSIVRKVSRKERDGDGSIKKISRVEIVEDKEIDRFRKISHEGPADYHVKHNHHHEHDKANIFMKRELSVATEEVEEQETVSNQATVNANDGVRLRKTSVFYINGLDVQAHDNDAFVPDENDNQDNDKQKQPVTRKITVTRVDEGSAEFNPDDYDSKQWPQVIAAFAANMGALAFGTVMAWSATGLESLHKQHGDMAETTSEQDSWIVSLAILGALCACPIAGVGLEKIGRRKVMIYLTLPFVLGWLSIAFAQNIWMIYSGRFLTGLCGGAFSMAAPAFTAETADTKIRGGLGSLFDLLLSVGMLYIYVVGAFTEWRVQAFACAVIPILFHVLMFFVPESPRFLVEKQKTAKAEKAIYWLKGVKTSPQLIEYELSELEKSVGDVQGQKLTLKDTLKKPIVKPTLLMVGIMFFTTMSGVDAVIAYTVDIFVSAGVDMNPKLCSIIIGIVIVVATIPAAVLVDIAGRRILLLISEVFMSLSLIGLGFYFHVKIHQIVLLGWITSESLNWLPLTCLNLFIIAYSLGCGPLCMIMTGELLPNYMKGLTSSIVLMSRWGFAFFVTKFFEGIKEEIQDDYTYWGFAVICAVGAVYVYFFIPETMGKTVDEIQIYFVKVSKDKKENVVKDFSMHES